MNHNDNKYLKRFGKRVRYLREKKGISQEKLAEMTGLHRTYIGSVERGEKNIALKNMVKIAKKLGVTMEKLFKW